MARRRKQRARRKPATKQAWQRSVGDEPTPNPLRRRFNIKVSEPDASHFASARQGFESIRRLVPNLFTSASDQRKAPVARPTTSKPQPRNEKRGHPRKFDYQRIQDIAQEVRATVSSAQPPCT